MYKGITHKHSTGFSFILRSIDSFIIMASLLGIFLLSHAEKIRFNEYLILGLVSVIAVQFISEFSHLYRSYRGEPITHEFITIWKTWIIVVAIPLVFGFITKQTEGYSRIVLTTWVVLVPLLICIQRSITRQLLQGIRNMGVNHRYAGICGDSEQALALAETINATRESGIRLTGIYVDSQHDDTSSITPIGSVADMIKLSQAGELDIVYLALPLHEIQRTNEIIRELANSTVNLYVVPSFDAYDLFRSPVSSIGNIPLLSVFDTPIQGIDGAIKRIEDIILGSIALLLAIIPMTIIGIAVKLTSPGSILFKQRRYGIDGKPFDVWKFRTMAVCENSEVSIEQAQKDDSRITKFGSFLRRTSLDELPQLLNVLQGNMSLVGPRPHAVAHNEEYRKLIHGYMLRHKVKPGITGLAQIRGWRGETDTLEKMEKRIESDLEYIRNWSIALDLKILFLTFLHGFIHKNAY